VEIVVASEQVQGGIAVNVQVRLAGREANRLFVAGDRLIQLPLDGSLPDADGSPIPRMSIFLSELAGTRDGLTRVFEDQASADSFAAIVRSQLETALEAS
jgi:hypothetical protein